MNRISGYIISAILYILNYVISDIYELLPRNTWWALLGIYVIITPSFIQTIHNIKYKKYSNIALLYLILIIFILLYIAGTLMMILALLKVIKLPLY